jgi:beta-mannosidase
VTESSHQRLSTNLDGEWLAMAAAETNRLAVGDPDLDDSDWLPTNVPGHWRDSLHLANAESVLYRHRFSMQEPAQGRRRWLSIDGLFYQGDVWLDGAYLGDTEGYFVQHVFDITDRQLASTDHLLAIEATCAKIGDPDQKRNITGTLQDSNHLDIDANPGGLWRNVRVEETGPVRIDGLRVLVLEAEPDRAIVRLTAELDARGNHNAIIRTCIDPAADRAGSGESALHENEHVLAAGRNTVEWHIAVEQPELWWPHSLGDQPLYDVRLEVIVDDEVSHTRKRRTGMRRFEMHHWVASINGERLFLKGTNLAPTKLDMADATAADHRVLLDLARDAGLDLVRVHGHIASPDLYRQADRLGMLIWQDFPLQWGHARTVRAQAERQATALVDQLGHHPSIVMWSGHNEPGAAEQRRNSNNARRDPKALLKRRAREQLPSWNRTVLDRTVKMAFTRADPSRPVSAHSGVAPHPPQLDGTDSHLWFGWRHGAVRDLTVEAKRLGRRLRFVSEFGAQSIPHDAELAKLVNASGFPQLADHELERLGASLDRLERHSPRSAHDNYDSWVTATQRYQAWLVRRSVEILRRLKYRPVGGYCQFFLADSSQRISEAVIDHERRPKLAWRALAEASRPVIVVADLPETELPRHKIKTAIHVVSDLRSPIENARVVARWSINDSLIAEHTYEGRFEADSVTRVAVLDLHVDFGPGIASLELRLDAHGENGEVSATNSYHLRLPERPHHLAVELGRESTKHRTH